MPYFTLNNGHTVPAIGTGTFTGTRATAKAEPGTMYVLKHPRQANHTVDSHTWFACLHMCGWLLWGRTLHFPHRDILKYT